MQCLGYRIRKDIITEVETAKKLFRFGLILKQVANFYHDIGTQMIPCQKPMMLRDAEEFEKVLKNPRDSTGMEITWKNVHALEGYLARLEKVSRNLTEKNRYEFFGASLRSTKFREHYSALVYSWHVECYANGMEWSGIRSWSL